MPTPGAATSTVGAIGRADCEHLRVRGWIAYRASLQSLVPRGRDDERPRPVREHDRVLEQRILLLAPEAEVDHAGALTGGLGDALDRGALVEDSEGAGIPDPQHRLGIDPDDSEAVVRGGDHGADLGAVVLLVVGRRLSVHQDRVRPARELRVRDVESGIDHRHRLAGARRVDAVGADRAPPPLGRHERVGRLGRGRDREQPFRLAEADDARAAQGGQGRGGHAPDPARVRYRRRAGPGQRRPGRA